MAQPKSSRIQVVMYLIIVLTFSSFFYFLILHSGSLGYGRGMYVFGLMWCPALAGMLTLRLNARSIADLGWKWGETKYQLHSWYIPLLYASIAYAIVWIFRLGAFGNPEFYDSLVKSMHLGGPHWISIVLGILPHRHVWHRSQHYQRAWRRNWLARLSRPRAFQDHLFHYDFAHQRHRLVALALSHPDLWRLQRRHSDLVWPHLLYSDGDLHQFCVCLDAPQIRQPLDRRDPSRQPQPLYTGYFHAASRGTRERRSGSSTNLAASFPSSSFSSPSISGASAANSPRPNLGFGGGLLSAFRQQNSFWIFV